MNLDDLNFQTIQRLKMDQRRETARQIASGEQSPKESQNRNSWFKRPAQKRILNAREIAQHVMHSK